MKTVSVRDLQKSVRDSLRSAQEEQVVVTRHGKPVAVLVGVEGEEWEDLVLQMSPAFWKLIEKRRKEKTVPLEDVRRRVSRAGGKS